MDLTVSENSTPEGFKMTEFGPLPDDWVVVNLGDKGHFQYGYTTSATEEDTGTKFLRITDIKEDGFVNWGTVPYGIIEDESLQKFRLSKGDILFARIGATTGKTCIIGGAIPNAVFASYLIRFVPDKELHPIYVFHFTQTRKYQELVNAGKEGKLKKGLSATELKNFKIPLPSLPEQQKIAKVLSTVQQAKEKTDAVISATKEFKKSLMTHLFSYGPVPVKKFNELDELGVNELQNAQNSINLKETEIGLVPEEWDLVKLKEVFKVTSGKTRPKKFKSVASDVFVYPIFGGNGIMGYSDEYLIEFSTIIIGRVGAYCGSVHISKDKSWISDNALYVKKFHSKDIDLNYLATALNLLNLNRLKNTGGQPLISQSIVYSQFVPIPPPTIQQKIASILSAVDKKIEAEQAKKNSLDELFKSLLHNLMTGKVRVNHIEVML